MDPITRRPFRLFDLPQVRVLAERYGVPVPCGKHVHASEGAAAAQSRALTRREIDARPEAGLAPYYCRRCQGWHVGHQLTTGEGASR